MAVLRRRSFIQLALTVLLALLIAYGIQRFVVGVFRVPTDSMSRTLLPGDRLLAARFWYSIERPKRGDIVVLHPNGQGQRVYYADGASRRVFVKRIVALPGEWVKARHGRIAICTGPGGSGCVPLSEPYVRGTTQTFGPIAVPPGRYFVMGDNRGQLARLSDLGAGAARSADRAGVGLASPPSASASSRPAHAREVSTARSAVLPAGGGRATLGRSDSPSVSAPPASSSARVIDCSGTTHAHWRASSSPAPTRPGGARSRAPSSPRRSCSTTVVCRAGVCTSLAQLDDSKTRTLAQREGAHEAVSRVRHESA